MRCLLIVTFKILAAWWLQSRAPTLEGRLRIPEGATFCLSDCHKIYDLQPMGEGESMSYEQMPSAGTGRIRTTLSQWWKKDYTILNAERIVYISLYIITFTFSFCCVFFYAHLTFVLMMIGRVERERFRPNESERYG